MKEIVLITGAGGLIAQELSRKISNNYEIRFLTRNKKHEKDFEWDVRKGTIDERHLKTFLIIHLAGANISEKRWTTERKKELISSRVDSAKLILDIVRKKYKAKIFHFCLRNQLLRNNNFEKIFTEKDGPGNDF
jgi:NAD dependent epimerase/dehydratase family enzyme